ncbi:hypothetical protein ACOMHN_058495 [Nucella lapillus]
MCASSSPQQNEQRAGQQWGMLASSTQRGVVQQGGTLASSAPQGCELTWSETPEATPPAHADSASRHQQGKIRQHLTQSSHIPPATHPHPQTASSTSVEASHTPQIVANSDRRDASLHNNGTKDSNATPSAGHSHTCSQKTGRAARGRTGSLPLGSKPTTKIVAKVEPWENVAKTSTVHRIKHTGEKNRDSTHTSQNTERRSEITNRDPRSLSSSELNVQTEKQQVPDPVNTQTSVPQEMTNETTTTTTTVPQDMQKMRNQAEAVSTWEGVHKGQSVSPSASHRCGKELAGKMRKLFKEMESAELGGNVDMIDYMDSLCDKVSMIDSMDSLCDKVSMIDSLCGKVSMIDSLCGKVSMIDSMDSLCGKVSMIDCMDSLCGKVSMIDSMDSLCGKVSMIDSLCGKVRIIDRMDFLCGKVSMIDSLCGKVSMIDSLCGKVSMIDSLCGKVSMIDSLCGKVRMIDYMDSLCGKVSMIDYIDSLCGKVSMIDYMDSLCGKVSMIDYMDSLCDKVSMIDYMDSLCGKVSMIDYMDSVCDKVSMIDHMDSLCGKVGIQVVALYTRPVPERPQQEEGQPHKGQVVVCQIFYDHRQVGRGEGETCRSAEDAAYGHLGRGLMVGGVDRMVRGGGRLPEEPHALPGYLAMVHKGSQDAKAGGTFV